MKNRNPIAVALLPFVTFGIYGLVWSVKTKNEMNVLGAQIPTAWLLIVPFVNIWWLWKYSEGVEMVSGGKLSTIMSFVLQFLIGTIGAAIVQDSFNHIGANATTSTQVVDTPYPQTYSAVPQAAAPAPETYAPAPGFGGPAEAPATPEFSQNYQPNTPAPAAPANPAPSDTYTPPSPTQQQ